MRGPDDDRLTQTYIGKDVAFDPLDDVFPLLHDLHQAAPQHPQEILPGRPDGRLGNVRAGGDEVWAEVMVVLPLALVLEVFAVPPVFGVLFEVCVYQAKTVPDVVVDPADQTRGLGFVEIRPLPGLPAVASEAGQEGHI